MDIQGRVVFESDIINGINSYDKLNVASGSYQLKITVDGYQYMYKLSVIE